VRCPRGETDVEEERDLSLLLLRPLLIHKQLSLSVLCYGIFSAQCSAFEIPSATEKALDGEQETSASALCCTLLPQRPTISAISLLLSAAVYTEGVVGSGVVGSGLVGAREGLRERGAEIERTQFVGLHVVTNALLGEKSVTASFF
jgi:hypothetical protein